MSQADIVEDRLRPSGRRLLRWKRWCCCLRLPRLLRRQRCQLLLRKLTLRSRRQTPLPLMPPRPMSPAAATLLAGRPAHVRQEVVSECIAAAVLVHWQYRGHAHMPTLPFWSSKSALEFLAFCSLKHQIIPVDDCAQQCRWSPSRSCWQQLDTPAGCCRWRGQQ
jgi:hypothetical protein